MAHKAILWEPLAPGDRRVRCNLCAHRCVIPPGKLGACCVRENVDGELVTLVYERTSRSTSTRSRRSPVSFPARHDRVLHRPPGC